MHESMSSIHSTGNDGYVALAVYKIDHSVVDGNPEARFKCLKELVGERGFEPPTPWSRTRFRDLLKSVEFPCFQVIAVERVARRCVRPY
jgi:hypothetical protein